MNDQDEIRRLRDQIESLERELRAAKELAWLGLASSTWRHKISGEAINVKNCVDLIRRSEADDLQERTDKYLDWISRAASSILDTPVTGPISSQMPSLHVGHFLADYARRVHEHMLPADVKISLGSSVEAYAKVDPLWFRHCLDILVHNAIQAMRNSPEKVLTIGAALVEETIEVSISDTGPGVPDALRTRIFQTPIESGERTGKLGYGLLLAKFILEALHGDLRLNHTKQAGAEFIISLPKA